MSPYLMYAVLVVIIGVAQWSEKQRKHVWLVGVGLNGLILAFIFLDAMVVVSTLQQGVYDARLMQGYILLSTVGIPLTLLITNSHEFRLWLERRFGSRQARYTNKREPLYNPRSGVHTAAAVLIILYLLITAFGFVAVGGLDGMAAEYQTTQTTDQDSNSSANQDFTSDTTAEIAALAALLEGLLVWIGFALLGVGFIIRRDTQQTAERLGFHTLSIHDFWVGPLFGLAIYTVVFIINILESLLIPPEVRAVQDAASASAVAEYSQSIGLWFAMAFAAGIGEEIFFRGAIQPIFGSILTALFFALVHEQYAFTFTWVIVFASALCFSWLRRNYSIVAAILAHGTYNFAPVLLLLFLNSLSGGG